MTEDQTTPTHINTPLIDLDFKHATYVRGDITVILTWTLNNRRGCMVLVPSFITRSQRIVPCIVRLEDAWRWDERIGDGAFCAEMCVEFAPALGLSAFNTAHLRRIAGLINNHIGDLLAIPPMPESEMEVLADVLLTDTSTGKSIEREIIDHVY